MQLIILPGFLGTTSDFDNFITLLPEYLQPTVIPVYPQLPLKLQPRADTDNAFDHAITQWFNANKPVFENEFILLGYSLGARVAMGLSQYLLTNKQHRVLGLILESGNTGLTSTADRVARASCDAVWHRVFSEQPLEQALTQWYKQPVFSSLSEQQKQRLVNEKSHLQSAAIVAQMEVFGLSKQPNYGEWLQACKLPILTISGEQDAKFVALAGGITLASREIAPKCGHNVHFEAPAWYAKTVVTFLKRELII